MAGRGLLDPATSVSCDRVLKYTFEEGWAPGTEPLHASKSGKGGAGLAASFARAMADAEPGVTIGLIPCAVGGTPLARWMKGGDLYEQAVNRTRKALPDGTLKGILWHQGEHDSKREESARHAVAAGIWYPLRGRHAATATIEMMAPFRNQHR